MSISLPDDDVDFVDDYAQAQGYASRSAVIQRAVRLLRATEMGAAYEQAWDEWLAADAAVWEPTVGDGITPPKSRKR